MMQKTIVLLAGIGCWIGGPARVPGEPRWKPDRDNPGDPGIRAHLTGETDKIHPRFAEGIKTADDWARRRPRYQREYYHMLGLWPLPEKTPLHATVTGTLSGEGYVVDKIHYQSRPNLYVTGNLYRPAKAIPGARLPAVFYVCGHAGRGRNGNKTAYMSHGIWFARHGYVCLVVDSLQLGEIAAIHHGTYREQRWWWHSRGYTSAGIECWNGVRGIDYLISRPDVDPQRIAVTGISGGGAATFWIAAADERVAVAVPVSGMADLLSYVTDHVINGHCDCMFLYNTYRWPWTRIAALIAPRPMLFVNSDHDTIFPMDANERISNRLERFYSLFGASDKFGTVVSIGGHAYRKDIRQAAFRFINTHLKNDPTTVTDTEVDLVTVSGGKYTHPIDPEKLRVFPTDTDIPADELNTTIDRHFVDVAKVAPPEPGQYDNWKKQLADQLREVTFGYFPDRIPAARSVKNGDMLHLQSEPHVEYRLRAQNKNAKGGFKRVVLIVANPDDGDDLPAWYMSLRNDHDGVFVCSPRGVGPTRWTRKNPPNYVERSFALLGRTVDTGRVWDIAATVRYLRDKQTNDVPVYVAGQGAAGVLAAYAALVEPDIAGVIAIDPPAGHMDNTAPALLNVLRVCDIPEVFGMVAPRPLTIIGGNPRAMDRIAAIYQAAGATENLSRRAN